LKSDIEAVYISSANAYHYEQVIDAAKAHKNILCEKPLAMSSQQAKEMIQVCNENNVFLTVYYLYRFHPLIIKAKELIDKQVIGKIVFIKIDFNINFLPGDNFRYNKNLSGGGALRDLGTHLIDLLRFFNDEMKVISGVLDNVIYKNEVEDFATALFKFENGGYGLITVSYCVSKSFNRIEIIGQKGSIAIDNIIRAKTNQTGKLIITKEGEVKFAFRRRANKLLRLLKSVNKSFLKNESPIISGNDGLINLQLIEEIEEQCKAKKI
jgi:predicted dehydrogenase